MKRNVLAGSLLFVAGMGAGMMMTHVPRAVASAAPAAKNLSQQTFLVSIDEIRRNVVFGHAFAGHYGKTVTMADGSTRHIELTPMVHDGMQVVRLKDNGGVTYMGLDGAASNGKLMVRVRDLALLKKQMRDEGWPVAGAR